MGTKTSSSSGHFFQAAPVSNQMVLSQNNTSGFDHSRSGVDPKMSCSKSMSRGQKMVTNCLMDMGDSKKIKVVSKKSLLTSGFPAGLTSQDSLFVINNSIH